MTEGTLFYFAAVEWVLVLPFLTLTHNHAGVGVTAGRGSAGVRREPQVDNSSLVVLETCS